MAVHNLGTRRRRSHALGVGFDSSDRIKGVGVSMA
jgi:hypothetical protein